MINAVESILKHEGFRPKPYPDPINGWDVPTFGHGLTYITEEESEAIVRDRVVRLSGMLAHEKQFFYLLPPTVQQVLIEMAYQMGVSGVMKFKKMWAALAERDYETAAKEMLDSRWARQTPARAEELAGRMKGAGK